ncbi:cytochrome c551 [Virgibacillus sp. DJP39]|uniref:cytochrome c551 n=1 Tax=Virgibacillus sp. DJP39 TaxID=3409790 RepID=UPI003BB80B61
MKYLLFILFISLILIISACSGNQDQTTSDNGSTTKSGQAEKVFQNNCAYCHGSDLSGGAGPSLTEVGSLYTEKEIAEIIKEGKGAMPKGLIEGEKVELIVSWLAQKK